MAYRDIGVRVQNPCYQRQKLRSVRPIWMYVCANGEYTTLSLAGHCAASRINVECTRGEQEATVHNPLLQNTNVCKQAVHAACCSVAGWLSSVQLRPHAFNAIRRIVGWLHCIGGGFMKRTALSLSITINCVPMLLLLLLLLLASSVQWLSATVCVYVLCTDLWHPFFWVAEQQQQFNQYINPMLSAPTKTRSYHSIVCWTSGDSAMSHAQHSLSIHCDSSYYCWRGGNKYEWNDRAFICCIDDICDIGGPRARTL